MRQAVTLGRRHGETTYRMIIGPDVPITEHTKRLKAMRVAGSDPEYCEIQIWQSDSGRTAKFEPRKREAKKAPVQSEKPK